MTETLTLPRMGETMESGRVVGWLKQPGEAFRRGETIVEIESDKTVVELPALADGVLTDILAPQGADVAVGAPLCSFRPTGAIAAAGAAAMPGIAPSTGREPVPAPAAALPAVPAPAPQTDERPRATPLARRLARQHGIALAEVKGTGRRGRVEASDIRARSAPAAPIADGMFVQHWPASGPHSAGRAVLLHGFGGDAQTWATLAMLLAQRGLDVIAPDLPGHGATTLAATSLDMLAAPLGALCEGPVELVGHSLGAAVAVALARVSPAQIRRLTLIAPAGLDSAIDGEFVAGLAAGPTAGGLAHLLRRLSPRPPQLSADQMARMAAQLARGRLAALASVLAAGGRQQIDILPDLAALPMPVRVVWGTDDRIIPWTQVVRLPARVAIHLIAGAGHMPHWDAPHLIAALFDP